MQRLIVSFKQSLVRGLIFFQCFSLSGLLIPMTGLLKDALAEHPDAVAPRASDSLFAGEWGCGEAWGSADQYKSLLEEYKADHEALGKKSVQLLLESHYPNTPGIPVAPGHINNAMANNERALMSLKNKLQKMMKFSSLLLTGGDQLMDLRRKIFYTASYFSVLKQLLEVRALHGGPNAGSLENWLQQYNLVIPFCALAQLAGFENFHDAEVSETFKNLLSDKRNAITVDSSSWKGTLNGESDMILRMGQAVAHTTEVRARTYDAENPQSFVTAARFMVASFLMENLQRLNSARLHPASQKEIAEVIPEGLKKDLSTLAEVPEAIHDGDILLKDNELRIQLVKAFDFFQAPQDPDAPRFSNDQNLNKVLGPLARSKLIPGLSEAVQELPPPDALSDPMQEHLNARIKNAANDHVQFASDAFVTRILTILLQAPHGVKPGQKTVDKLDERGVVIETRPIEYFFDVNKAVSPEGRAKLTNLLRQKEHLMLQPILEKLIATWPIPLSTMNDADLEATLRRILSRAKELSVSEVLRSQQQNLGDDQTPLQTASLSQYLSAYAREYGKGLNPKYIRDWIDRARANVKKPDLISPEREKLAQSLILNSHALQSQLQTPSRKMVVNNEVLRKVLKDELDRIKLTTTAAAFIFGSAGDAHTPAVTGILQPQKTPVTSPEAATAYEYAVAVTCTELYGAKPAPDLIPSSIATQCKLMTAKYAVALKEKVKLPTYFEYRDQWIRDHVQTIVSLNEYGHKLGWDLGTQAGAITLNKLPLTEPQKKAYYDRTEDDYFHQSILAIEIGSDKRQLYEILAQVPEHITAKEAYAAIDEAIEKGIGHIKSSMQRIADSHELRDLIPLAKSQLIAAALLQNFPNLKEFQDKLVQMSMSGNDGTAWARFVADYHDVMGPYMAPMQSVMTPMIAFQVLGFLVGPETRLMETIALIEGPFQRSAAPYMFWAMIPMGGDLGLEWLELQKVTSLYSVSKDYFLTGSDKTSLLEQSELKEILDRGNALRKQIWISAGTQAMFMLGPVLLGGFKRVAVRMTEAYAAEQFDVLYRASRGRTQATKPNTPYASMPTPPTPASISPEVGRAQAEAQVYLDRAASVRTQAAQKIRAQNQNRARLQKAWNPRVGDGAQSPQVQELARADAAFDAEIAQLNQTEAAHQAEAQKILNRVKPLFEEYEAQLKRYQSQLEGIWGESYINELAGNNPEGAVKKARDFLVAKGKRRAASAERILKSVNEHCLGMGLSHATLNLEIISAKVQWHDFKVREAELNRKRASTPEEKSSAKAAYRKAATDRHNAHHHFEMIQKIIQRERPADGGLDHLIYSIKSRFDLDTYRYPNGRPFLTQTPLENALYDRSFNMGLVNTGFGVPAIDFSVDHNPTSDTLYARLEVPEHTQPELLEAVYRIYVNSGNRPTRQVVEGLTHQVEHIRELVTEYQRNGMSPEQISSLLTGYSNRNVLNNVNGRAFASPEELIAEINRFQEIGRVLLDPVARHSYDIDLRLLRDHRGHP